MASRMSNRDRIQRMAQEAEATRREKAEKAKAPGKAKAKAKAKKKTKPGATRKATSRAKAAKGRMKIVWAVCVPAGKALKIFPYREKAEAQAEADRLTAKKGTLHVLRSERQPMEEGE